MKAAKKIMYLWRWEDCGGPQNQGWLVRLQKLQMEKKGLNSSLIASNQYKIGRSSYEKRQVLNLQ